MIAEKRFSTWMVGGLVIGFGLMTSTLTGCASGRRLEAEQSMQISRLEVKLRKAKAEIETLREHNLALKNRIKIVRENGGEDPQTADTLAAFRPGVETDVPISPTVNRSNSRTRSLRQDVAAIPNRLPPKRSISRNSSAEIRSLAQAPVQAGEQADRVLARTVDELLRSGNEVEAERTASLLEKSYPDSDLVAETRFQQGLYFFRKKNLPQADRLFQATLASPKAHVRARAGAALMRGVIARQLAGSGRSSTVARANLELSRKSFEYVRQQFPGSPEAKRASRELRAISSNQLRAASSTRIR